VSPDDVRVLVQLVIYLDLVIPRDGWLAESSWDAQMGDAERAALQRLIDELGI